MTFREVAEHTRRAVEQVAGEIRGARDLTPMLHLCSPLGIEHAPIDGAFFASRDTRAQLALIVARLVRESHATIAGWTFSAWGSNTPGRPPSDAEDRRELIVAVLIDRERHEVWQAPVVRVAELLVIGAWAAWPPNAADGPLIAPIQEAMR